MSPGADAALHFMNSFTAFTLKPVKLLFLLPCLCSVVSCTCGVVRRRAFEVCSCQTKELELCLRTESFDAKLQPEASVVRPQSLFTCWGKTGLFALPRSVSLLRSAVVRVLVDVRN